jgi:hypothetical protein
LLVVATVTVHYEDGELPLEGSLWGRSRMTLRSSSMKNIGWFASAAFAVAQAVKQLGWSAVNTTVIAVEDLLAECEFRIPREKFDPFLLLKLIEEHGGTVH